MPAGKPKAARFYALLSIGAAVSTITLKFGAYHLEPLKNTRQTAVRLR